MKQYLELFIQVAFAGIIFFCVGALVFALLAESLGWYDRQGKWVGPKSKRK
jgi:hypothetical protein